MGRPAKTLEEHVRTGSFRARRAQHEELLGGPPVRWPLFAGLQAEYRRARSEPERRDVALRFQRHVRELQHRIEERLGEHTASGGGQQLLVLPGKPGSLAALLGFFPAYLTHPKGPKRGERFELEAFQRQFLREFYRCDKHGERVYQRGVLGLPRGNGKTPLAAGLGLYELLTRTDAPEVYCAAGSKEQAGVALDFARDFVEQGELADWVSVGRVLRCSATKGVMRVVSSEGTLQHGLAPAVALIDELWGFETSRQEQTFIALGTGLHKRDNAYQLAITTAGYDQHSLLGDIYQQALKWPDVSTSKHGCLTVCKDEENGQLLYWYGAPAEADIEDPKIWRAVNPASWIKLSLLKRQLAAAGVGELEFRRLHLNQWTAARDAWLPGSTWRDLHSELEIPAGAPIYAGVDIGLVHDSTAVCIAHKTPQGRILLRARVWSALPDSPCHEFCPGGKVELERIENYIRQLARTYTLREVAYDPRFFERSAQLLEKEGVTMVEYQPTAAPLADAAQTFYQLAREGTLGHDNDPILTSHIEATAAERTERGWKLRKLKSSQQIDATIAAILATARAIHATDPPVPRIYWMEM